MTSLGGVKAARLATVRPLEGLSVCFWRRTALPHAMLAALANTGGATVVHSPRVAHYLITDEPPLSSLQNDDDMLTPTGYPPPNTAAGTAHSAHSTQPALRPHRATPRVEAPSPIQNGPTSVPSSVQNIASSIQNVPNGPSPILSGAVSVSSPQNGPSPIQNGPISVPPSVQNGFSPVRNGHSSVPSSVENIPCLTRGALREGLPAHLPVWLSKKLQGCAAPDARGVWRAPGVPGVVGTKWLFETICAAGEEGLERGGGAREGRRGGGAMDVGVGAEEEGEEQVVEEGEAETAAAEEQAEGEGEWDDEGDGEISDEY